MKISIVMAILMVMGTAHAAALFDATSSNSTFTDNNVNASTANTLTGDLVFTHTGGNNNAAGFSGTDSINDLLGTGISLADTNTVIFKATIDSITGGALKNNMFRFGMAPDTSGITPDGNLVLALGTTLSGFNATSLNDPPDAGWTVTQESLRDGFGITLTVNNSGWTFELTDVIAASGTIAPLSGTLTGTQFVDSFGGGHFAISTQMDGSGDVVTTFSEASITVISELSATIVDFSTTPTIFDIGETVTLRWDVLDADSVTIDNGIGAVAAVGSLAVFPTNATTWTLSALRGDSTFTAQASAKPDLGPVDVYLLGGQSNMLGKGRISKLPEDLLSIPNIRLYADGPSVSSSFANQWVDFQPTSSDATFGLEFGIAERLQDLCPGRTIALIKYSYGGTSLELDWKPGPDASDTANWGSKFSAFMHVMTNGIAALEAEGWQPVIKAMCWHQGEQDAKDGVDAPESSTSADDYGANLVHFIGRIREQFAAYAAPEGIRFVAGQVLPYAPAGGDVVTRFTGRDLVRQGILDIDEDSGSPLSVTNTVTIPTNDADHPTHAQEIDGYLDTDEIHLNATAQLAIGRSMAYAMLYLEPAGYEDWAAAYELEGGFGDDDDLDGLSNGSEYMLHGDPTTSTNAPWPALSFADSSPVCTLTRDLEAADAAFDIAFSTDLINWTNVPAIFISSERQSNDTSILSYRSPLPLDGVNPKGFFRVTVVME